MKASEVQKKIKQAYNLIYIQPNYSEAVKILDIIISENTQEPYVNMLKMLAETEKDYNLLLDMLNDSLTNEQDDKVLLLAIRGNVYHKLDDYEKAIKDFTKVIELDENYVCPYFDRALSYYYSKKNDKAFEDLSKSIELYPNYYNNYNYRGNIYFELDKFKEAIIDYNKAKELSLNKYLFQDKIDKAEIALEEQIANEENQKRKEVYDLVDEIQKELLFKEEQICHYTSLEVLKLLIDIDKPSKLRFSHIDLLNDATEGIAFYDYLLGKEIVLDVEKKDRASFIGSFVESGNNNNLSMWRAYGNDAQGVSICLNKSVFEVKKKESQENNSEVRSEQKTESDRNLYHVAYLDKAGNKVYVKGEENTEILDKLEKIKEIIETNPKDDSIKEPLEKIKFLFKDAIFQDEKELRYFKVLPNESTSIKWDVNFNPPRTFIELDSNIREKIACITIGPKAKKAPGWSAFFETQLAKLGNKEVVITQSKMPYR